MVGGVLSKICRMEVRMIFSSPIPAPHRSLNSATFGGDGGRLCVIGGGCNDAAELGRDRKSCFYSCSSCFQFEIRSVA